MLEDKCGEARSVKDPACCSPFQARARGPRDVLVRHTTHQSAGVPYSQRYDKTSCAVAVFEQAAGDRETRQHNFKGSHRGKKIFLQVEDAQAETDGVEEWKRREQHTDRTMIRNFICFRIQAWLVWENKNNSSNICLTIFEPRAKLPSQVAVGALASRADVINMCSVTCQP